MSNKVMNETEVKGSIEKLDKFPADPMDLVTSKFTPKEILFHANGFVVAAGDYENEYKAIACRWHIAGEIGYPSSFGKSQWMRMGNLTMRNVEKISKDGQFQQELLLNFMKLDASIRVGSWVRYRNIWYMVCGLSPVMDGNVANCQLSDGSNRTPIRLANVEEVISKEISFFKWHREHAYSDSHIKKCLVWLSAEGVVSITRLCPNDGVSIVSRRTLQMSFSGDFTEVSRDTLNYGKCLHGQYLLGVVDMVCENLKQILNLGAVKDLYNEKVPIVKRHIELGNNDVSRIETKSFETDADLLLSQNRSVVVYYQVN